jgi:hypothetical protein
LHLEQLEQPAKKAARQEMVNGKKALTAHNPELWYSLHKDQKGVNICHHAVGGQQPGTRSDKPQQNTATD